MKYFNIRAAIAPLFSGSGRNNRNRPSRKTDFSDEDVRYMRMAIDLSVENIDNGDGSFGAVIVRDGEVIATGVNRVVPNNGPTAHAEVNAVRNTYQKLDTFQLEGYIVYSSYGPCLMCLSVLYWAGVKRICYGNTKVNAKAIDFNDSLTYDQLDLGYDQRSIHCERFLRDEVQKTFRKWQEKSDKIPY